MKYTYSLLFVFSLMFSSYTAPVFAEDPIASVEQNDDLFPESTDVEIINNIMNNIPEQDLSLKEKLNLGWQFVQMQATEHPYYCIAGVTVTAATLAALIYYARNR